MQGRRAPHDVDERCTSTPHTARKRTAQARTARAGTAGARNASMGSASAHTASMHSKRMHSRYTQREHGGHKYDNASMHSASTKHGPVHPRDVDDVDERMSHDLANAAQVHHTPSTRVHSSSTHRMGTRSRHGLEHAPVNDKLSGRGNAAAHQCGATEHRETDATSRHASAARATQSRRTPHRRQPHQPRSAAPHPPSTRDGHTRHAAATPPRRQTRTQPTARRGTTEPVAAHTRACGPRPPQPLPTHGHPMCPIDFLPLLQCAAGRLRTAKPPCPSDAAPRRARDRRTAHRRRLQPRRSPAAPSPSISVLFRYISPR